MFSVLIMIFCAAAGIFASKSPQGVSSKEAGTVVNDGYGDYVYVPEGEFLMGYNFNKGRPTNRHSNMGFRCVREK